MNGPAPPHPAGTHPTRGPGPVRGPHPTRGPGPVRGPHPTRGPHPVSQGCGPRRSRGHAIAQWAEVGRKLRRLPPGRQIEYRREQISHPGLAGARLSLGLPRGQLADWRFPPSPADGSGVHVHDLGQAGWRVHRDRVHPDVSLLGHLRADVFHVGAVTGGAPDLGLTPSADGTGYQFAPTTPGAAQLPAGAQPLVDAARSGQIDAPTIENIMGAVMGLLAPATGGITAAFWLAWLGVQAALEKVFGTAGAGPGCCATGNCPPETFSWQSNEGSYSPADAGTFEAFAEAMILADWANLAACPADPTDPNAAWWSVGLSESRMGTVLQAAVQAWNASHDSSGTPQSILGITVPNSGGTRAISSVVIGDKGGPMSPAPVDVALNATAVAANLAAGIAAGDPLTYGVPSTTRVVAPGSVVSLVVNNGAALPAPQPGLDPDPAGGYPRGQVISIVMPPGAQFDEDAVTSSGAITPLGTQLTGPFVYQGGGAVLTIGFFASADDAHNGNDQEIVFTLTDAPNTGTKAPSSGGGGGGAAIAIVAGGGLLLALLRR